MQQPIGSSHLLTNARLCCLGGVLVGSIVALSKVADCSNCLGMLALQAARRACCTQTRRQTCNKIRPNSYAGDQNLMNLMQLSYSQKFPLRILTINSQSLYVQTSLKNSPLTLMNMKAVAECTSSLSHMEVGHRHEDAGQVVKVGRPSTWTEREASRHAVWSLHRWAKCLTKHLLKTHNNYDKTCNKSCNTCTSLAALISIVLRVYNIVRTCNLQPITAYRPMMVSAHWVIAVACWLNVSPLMTGITDMAPPLSLQLLLQLWHRSKTGIADCSTSPTTKYDNDHTYFTRTCHFE